MSGLRNRQQSTIYLITYSRADLSKVPTRQLFAEIVVKAFEQLDVAKVSHWVVSQENHADNDTEQAFGTHYHMAIKLTRRARWCRVRARLESENGIKVNFSSKHGTYYSAFQYVTKEDEHFQVSDGHPELSGPPATEAATMAKKGTAKKRGNSQRKGKKRERYTTFDVVELIREKKITSRLELINFAERQKNEGKTVLAEFIANRGTKIVQEALDLAREFDEAPKKLARIQKSRVRLLQEAYSGQCAVDCNGKWLECGLELLARHEIELSCFCSAIYKALSLGRGKYRNVYVYGPSNSGKSFIFKPLRSIFNTFTNPATGTFAWLGVEDAEVVLLNDFRWHPSIIAWADFLQLLEGDIVHIPAPKNVRSKDIECKRDTPFFATADAPIVLVKGGSLDQCNTQMMDVRWVFFHFWRQIPKEGQVELPACPKCFAKLIIDHSDIPQ